VLAGQGKEDGVVGTWVGDGGAVTVGTRSGGFVAVEDTVAGVPITITSDVLVGVGVHPKSALTVVAAIADGSGVAVAG
jgi:hypothetical protein